VEMGYLTVLQVRLGVKIGDLHAKDFNAFRKRQIIPGRLGRFDAKELVKKLELNIITADV
jgi:hypothetical protein